MSKTVDGYKTVHKYAIPALGGFETEICEIKIKMQNTNKMSTIHNT